MQKKYLEIKDYLLERIRSGEFKPDQAIPAERELAAQLGVSRMTVRKAIEELMYEGLLIRRKGSGAFSPLPKAPSPTCWWRPAKMPSRSSAANSAPRAAMATRC